MSSKSLIALFVIFAIFSQQYMVCNGNGAMGGSSMSDYSMGSMPSSEESMGGPGMGGMSSSEESMGGSGNGQTGAGGGSAALLGGGLDTTLCPILEPLVSAVDNLLMSLLHQDLNLPTTLQSLLSGLGINCVFTK